MGAAMNSHMVPKLLWSLPLTLLFTSLEASGQHRPTYPHPPQAADTATIENVQTRSSQRAHLNPAQLEQEVQELSSLAQDPGSRRGQPAPAAQETVSKLKRVEKLAKRLRKAIAQ